MSNNLQSKNPNENKQLWTVSQCAEFFHVHTSTIYRLLKNHEIPALKIGSDWRFDGDLIMQWARDQAMQYREPQR